MYTTLVKKLESQQEESIKLAQENCVEIYGKEVLEELQPEHYKSNTTFTCPPYWDQLLCWPPTPAGEQANQNCPSYIIGFISTQMATRECNDNGLWYNKIKNRSWTNYTTCYTSKETTVFLNITQRNEPDIILNYDSIITIIIETGFIISCIALIIAFSIMFFIKKLHYARNILHMHLFASFILRALSFIVITHSFIGQVGLPSDIIRHNTSIYFYVNYKTNNWTCKLMNSLWQYFIKANYSWMLMEGLYLHNLIFRPLVTYTSNSVKWYIIMGWGFPLIIVGCWVTARLLVEDTFCWTIYENYQVFIILALPTLLAILLNLCFFVRISIVVYLKLNTPVNENSRRYKKWVKSTFILMPLFGVHYAFFLLLYFLGQTNSTIEILWLFCDSLFGSFQGFFVAVLYCFLNDEVKTEVKQRLMYIFTSLAKN